MKNTIWLENVARKRLQRWIDKKLIGCQGGTWSRRLVKVFASLSGMIPLLAAVIRTLCNGWCTGRRFQRRASHTCCLDRGCEGEDSFEHYCECPQVLRFAAERLRLHMHGNRLEHFLLLTTLDVDTLVKRALLLYATYSASNSGRHTDVVLCVSSSAWLVTSSCP